MTAIYIYSKVHNYVPYMKYPSEGVDKQKIIITQGGCWMIN
jgi:hypothetical protein